MDYKKKYLKYKLKYLNLLGGVKSFKTKKNNGTDPDPRARSGSYTNQCMWLSIRDYLNNILGNNFTLDEIRNIASNNNRTLINNKNEEFDTDLHMDGLNNIIRTFDLQIHIYISYKKDGVLIINDEPSVIYGNPRSRNIVSIVSYGSHFELITLINDINIYNKELQSISREFTPNRELIIGKQNDKISKLTSENLIELDNLLDFSVQTNNVIFEIEQNIKKKEIEIKNHKNSFIFDSTENIDENTRIGLIVSFQEYEIILKTHLSDYQQYLKEFKDDIDKITKKINMLLKN
jgi:hypothetical protein